MGSINKKWTIEEEEVLLSQVKIYPKNLSFAFSATSVRTGRSVSACSSRYYSKFKGVNRCKKEPLLIRFFDWFWGIKKK